MTRKEAIQMFNDAADPGSFSTGAWIDRFVALGMLKLDEPKSISNRFTDVYLREGCANGTSSEQFQNALFDAGLMLVDVPR